MQRARGCGARKRGFQYVHTPCITGSDCEGAGEMFQVTTLLDSGEGKPTLPEKDAKEGGGVDYAKDFFGKPVFLTVSGQLAVENYACAGEWGFRSPGWGQMICDALDGSPLVSFLREGVRLPYQIPSKFKRLTAIFKLLTAL